MANVRHPWPEQAEQPGTVHIMRPSTPYMLKAARRWAQRNGYTVEAREFGDVLLLRWTRSDASAVPTSD